MSDCALCDRPTDAVVCTACMAEARRDIADVRCVHAELETTITRQVSKLAAVGSVSRSNPLPYDERASDAAYRLRETLVSWAVMVADENDEATAWRWGDVPAFLLSWSAWMRHHDAAPEFVTEIREAVARARRAVDRPAPRVYVGRCVTCGVGVYARKGAESGTCGVCRTQYDVDSVRAIMLEQVTEHLASATEISRALTTMDMPVTAATIRSLVHRGKLVARDSRPAYAGRRTPLYRMGDVLEILERRRTA